MAIFLNRLLRAAKLDRNVYEEVEADRSSWRQALFIVILSSVAASSGNFPDLSLIFMSSVAALITWWVWAVIIYLIGTKLFPEPQTHSDIGELLRTIGFSSAPGLLRFLGLIPGLDRVIYPISAVWMSLSMIVAVKQSLDCSGFFRAIGVCLTGWLCLFVFSGALMYLNDLLLRPLAK